MRLFSQYTPDSCYWAGFIAADGCVRKDRPQVHVTLQLNDIGHLVNLCRSFGGNVITTNSGYGKFYICDAKDHIQDLGTMFGIYALKSLTIEPPQLFHESHIAAFIRGLFDGDGSLSQAKNKSWELSFLGTQSMMQWCKYNIQKHVSQAGDPAVEIHKSIYRLRFVGRQTFDILEWLYGGSSENTRLERKYKKWQQIPVKPPKGIRLLSNNKWMVRRTINGKRCYLGCFSSEHDAQLAYLEACHGI